LVAVRGKPVVGAPKDSGGTSGAPVLEDEDCIQGGCGVNAETNINVNVLEVTVFASGLGFCGPTRKCLISNKCGEKNKVKNRAFCCLL
jgi:hypothetical protein